MTVLFTQVRQVSLWISDKVRFKNISLVGINVNLMYRLSYRPIHKIDIDAFKADKQYCHVLCFDCTSVLEKLTSTMTVSIWILSHLERVITRSSQWP